MLRPAAARSKAKLKKHVADGGGHEVSPPSEGASKKPASKDTPPVTPKKFRISGKKAVVATPPSATRRPAAAVQKVALKSAMPSPPPKKMGTTYYHKGGKIQISLGKKGYRVFTHTTDIVDKLVKWDRYPSQLAAWKAALAMCAP